jgi:protein phosphatase
MNINKRIEIAGLTDVGRARDHNEDFITWEKDLGLLLLADGMGGHNAGEVASKMAVESIVQEIKDSSGSLGDGEESMDEDTVCLSMSAISNANQSIFSEAATKPQYAGMGTTLVMALFHEDTLTIAHVGDSRLYRLRKGVLEQLTVDHSLYQEMIQGGYMSEAEAEKKLNKNMITRALGINIDVDIDVQQQTVETDDIILLCSDGLTDLVSDLEIQLTLAKSKSDMKTAAEQLVAKANDKGGIDNISIIIARVNPEFEKSTFCS